MSIKMEKEHNLNELLQKRQQELYLKEASIHNKPSYVGEMSVELPNNDLSETAPLLAKTRQLTASVTSQSYGKSQVQKFKDKRTITGEKRTMESPDFKSKQPGKLFKKNKPFFQSRVEMKLSRDMLNLQPSTSALGKTTNNKSDHILNSGGETLSKPNHICGPSGSKGFSSSVVSSKNSQTNVQLKVMPVVMSCGRDSANHSQIEGPTNRSIAGQSVRATAMDFQKTTECNRASSKMDREQQKKYLEMKMSGWILDSNGKWIKDENVEFDSDEEEPAHSL